MGIGWGSGSARRWGLWLMPSSADKPTFTKVRISGDGTAQNTRVTCDHCGAIILLERVGLSMQVGRSTQVALGGVHLANIDVEIDGSREPDAE